MDVEDGVAEAAHADQRIHPLPEKVRRIEVDAEGLAADLAQPVERFGVVGDETGMELDGDPNPVIFGVRGRLRPVRGGPLFPLPLERLDESGGQGQVTQLGSMCLWPATRAAGERDDRRHLELFRQLDGVAIVLVVRLSDLSLRMEWVAVARERADLESAGGNRLLKPLTGGIIGQQRSGIGVRLARVSANSDLDRLTASGLDVVQCFLERSLRKKNGEHPDFHLPLPSLVRPTLPSSPLACVP